MACAVRRGNGGWWKADGSESGGLRMNEDSGRLQLFNQPYKYSIIMNLSYENDLSWPVWTSLPAWHAQRRIQSGMAGI